MNCREQSNQKAFLLSIVKELETEFGGVVDHISTFKSQLPSIQDDQVLADLKSIDVAAERFLKIITQCYSVEEQERLLGIEYLREVRHDLRAAISGVMGYAELIQDSLEDIGAPQDLSSAAMVVHQAAREILLIIEKFVLEGAAWKEDTADLSGYLPTLNMGTVLIVDDSSQKREMLSRHLKQLGHEVTIVEDGFQALEYLKHNSPDIILLDLFMPGMNGDEVLQKLKADDRLKAIPVLIVSSSSDMDNVIKRIHLGADDYLPMPVNSTLLHARINACLTKKFARDREKKTLNELDEARQRLSTAIESIDEGFAVFDSSDVLITYNNRFKQLYPGVQSLGGNSIAYEDLVRENIKLGVYQVERRDSSTTGEASLNKKEIDDCVALKVSAHQNLTQPHVELLASGIWIEVIENKIPGGGIVSVHKDVSERQKNEERLEYLALHDGLTGLANRKKFEEVLNILLKESQENNLQFGVVFFDLDGFKNVNDTLGHDFGDFLLQTVADKLTNSVRDTDLIARFGGDEFAALITNIKAQEEIIQVAERCLGAIGTQVEKEGEVARFGISIGIALYPEVAVDAEGLLKRADAAMYEAKKAGKGTYRIANRIAS